jgi:plastocyanin
MGWGRRVLAGAFACAVLMWSGAPSAGATRAAVPVARRAAPVVTTVNVAINDTGFDPPALSVPVGTVVIWTNQGSAPHTVTAIDGSFASDDLTPGATFPYQFTQARLYQYRDIHTGDVGTVTVVSGALQGVTSPGGTSAAPGNPAVPAGPATSGAAAAGGPAMAFTGAGDWILGVLGAALLAFGVGLQRRNRPAGVPFRVDPETAITIERGRRQRTDLLPVRRRRFRSR